MDTSGMDEVWLAREDSGPLREVEMRKCLQEVHRLLLTVMECTERKESNIVFDGLLAAYRLRTIDFWTRRSERQRQEADLLRDRRLRELRDRLRVVQQCSESAGWCARGLCSSTPNVTLTELALQFIKAFNSKTDDILCPFDILCPLDILWPHSIDEHGDATAAQAMIELEEWLAQEASGQQSANVKNDTDVPLQGKGSAYRELLLFNWTDREYTDTLLQGKGFEGSAYGELLPYTEYTGGPLQVKGSAYGELLPYTEYTDVPLQGKGSAYRELSRYTGVPLPGKGSAYREVPLFIDNRTDREYTDTLLQGKGFEGSDYGELVSDKETSKHCGAFWSMLRGPGVLNNVLVTFKRGSCKLTSTCFLANTLAVVLLAINLAAVGAIAPETASDGSMQAGSSKSDTSNFWFGVVACVGVLFGIIATVVAIMQLRRSSRIRTVSAPGAMQQTHTMQRRSRVQYILEEETVHRMDL